MKKSFALLLAAFFAYNAVQAAVETGKTYRIVPAENTSKSLFVKNSSLSANAAVVVWTETDVPSQQWTASVGSEGTVSFRNVYTERYLTMAGSQLVQAAGVRMWWTLEPSHPESTFTLLNKDGEVVYQTFVVAGMNSVVLPHCSLALLRFHHPVKLSFI